MNEEFPPKKNDGSGANGLSSPCSSYDGSGYPYIKDVFPDEKLMIFTRKNVLWGADYTLNSKDAKASLSNIRRVETKYVDVGGDDEDESDDSEA